ncbi:hypothetical protein WN51_07453, partial [Melipona quadrifasciata]
RGDGRSRENGTFPGDSSEKRRAQAWLQADMPGYEREKMMRRRVAPAFYPLPLAGDPVDRDSRPRLHDFGRAGTTSGLYPFAITLLHNFRENSSRKRSGARRIMRYQYPKFRGFCRVAPVRSGTVLCGGIPLATSGERVRAVQSSQNPGDAPGFGRAAVGETPRESRIRGLSPNAFSASGAKKDSRPLRFVSKGVGPLRARGSFARNWETARTARRSVTESEAASDPQAAQ